MAPAQGWHAQIEKWSKFFLFFSYWVANQVSTGVGNQRPSIDVHPQAVDKWCYSPPDAAAQPQRLTPQAPQQHPRLGPCHPPMKIMCFQFFFLLLSCFMEVQVSLCVIFECFIFWIWILLLLITHDNCSIER